MNYQINLDGNEILLIGGALDAMPHGRVAALHAKIQAQITAQDNAASDKRIQEAASMREAWFKDEAEKRGLRKHKQKGR